MTRAHAVAAAALLLLLNVDSAPAQSVSIHQATLQEAGARTGEVSTDELRRILVDGSAIVLDTRPRAEFDAEGGGHGIMVDCPSNRHRGDG